MIQAVTHVQQEARRARVRHVTKAKACRRCPACYSGPKIVEKRTWPWHLVSAPDRPTPPTTSGCPAPWPPWPRTSPPAITSVPHSHERAQLIFAAHGAMLIATREGSWAVPPQRAVWMPGGVTHEIRMAGDVAMRTLYVRARRRRPAGPDRPRARRLAAPARADPAGLRAAALLRRGGPRRPADDADPRRDRGPAHGGARSAPAARRAPRPDLPRALGRARRDAHAVRLGPRGRRVTAHAGAPLREGDRPHLRRLAPAGPPARRDGDARRGRADHAHRARPRLRVAVRVHGDVQARARRPAQPLLRRRVRGLGFAAGGTDSANPRRGGIATAVVPRKR